MSGYVTLKLCKTCHGSGNIITFGQWIGKFVEYFTRPACDGFGCRSK